MTIDHPARNDNRVYDYSEVPFQVRAEYNTICEFIKHGSSVIDYGCGNGSLLMLLSERKACNGIGVELSASGVAATRSKGFEAYEARIDQPLPQFQNNQFDYSICNMTIQMVMFPEVVLQEMGRVSRKQIISFPNFAHIKNRLDLLFNGRMPHPMLFGYDWYSTGHIHQLSIRDFYDFCEKSGFRILETKCSGNSEHKPWKKFLNRLFPNLFATTCIALIEKK